MATKTAKSKTTVLISKESGQNKKSDTNGTYKAQNGANKADKAMTEAWKLIAKRKKD